MTPFRLLSTPPSPEPTKPRVSPPAKFSNYLRLRYYQYEVTFGLYVMTPAEKFILNTIVLTILGAMTYALYIGLESSLGPVFCQLLYYVSRSLSSARELCAP